MKREYYDKGNGYIMAWDERQKIYVPKHRIVMQQKLGRPLRKGEIVHHKDEIKTDNRISNLKLEHNYQQHAKDHGHRWEGEANPSKHMTQRHKMNLKKAWEGRKKRFGPTGAKNPAQLRKFGIKFGRQTPH
jgi:hypothetical protein